MNVTLRQLQAFVAVSQTGSLTLAAERLFITTRMWQHYEGGKYLMPPAFWELYLLKTGQISRPR